jgi:osmotically-inducible protein OsmY
MQRLFDRWLLIAATFAVVFCVAADRAQAQNMFGTTGGFGPNTANSFGSPMFGGTSPFGGSSSSMGGFGQTGMGGGMSSMGGQMGGFGQTGSMGFGGTGQSGSNFVGRNTGTNNQFVGRSGQTGQQTSRSTASRRSTTGRQFQSRNTSADDVNENVGGESSNSRTRRIVVPRYQIDFAFEQPTDVEVSASLRTTLDRFAKSNADLGPIQFDVENGREVVLRGEVESEQARRLAENLIRLEPGIRNVRNELTIRGNGS